MVKYIVGKKGSLLFEDIRDYIKAGTKIQGCYTQYSSSLFGSKYKKFLFKQSDDLFKNIKTKPTNFSSLQMTVPILILALIAQRKLQI